MYGRLFCSYDNCYLAFRLGDVMHFSLAFTCLIRRTEAVVTNS